jgi:DNA topoisomerase-3
LTAEGRVYELVARRYLAQFSPAFEFNETRIEIEVAGECFRASGRQTVAEGWHLCVASPQDGKADGESDTEAAEDDQLLPLLQDADQLTCGDVSVSEKQTRPPKRFTEATLVEAMTGIARYVEDSKIKQLLKETDGIGTPATQADIIETLFERKYIEQKKRQIISTSTGRALIAALPAAATQPDMTALWEAALRKIQDGQASLHQFLAAVTAQLQELVTGARVAPPMRLPGAETKLCPSGGCAGFLRMRKGASGELWACSRYPECKYTEDSSSRARKGGKGRRQRYRRNPGAHTAPGRKGKP